jgi:anti-anti-sigma regulatory factor
MLLHVENVAAGISGREATVVVLDGDFASLDPAGMLSIGELLADHAFRGESPQVVVDLSGARYVGSLFICLLVQVGRGLRKRGGGMVLCGARDFCAEVLSRAKLHLVWPLCDSRQEAVSLLEQTANVQ